jgi:hypothetical protein
MIDDMGRKRQERRFASQSRSKMPDAVEHAYGLSIEKLAEFFSPSCMLAVPPTLPASIKVRSLEDTGLGAFLVHQTIEVAQIPPYIMAIRNGREEVGWRHYKQADLQTLVRHDQELAGINMRLLTNDVSLIRKLACAGFNPPCPWIAFYELGPFVGSLQGNADYWYHHVWDPYWESLSFPEQADFLERKRRETVAYMSENEWRDWVEGLRGRDARAQNPRGPSQGADCNGDARG